MPCQPGQGAPRALGTGALPTPSSPDAWQGSWELPGRRQTETPQDGRQGPQSRLSSCQVRAVHPQAGDSGPSLLVWMWVGDALPLSRGGPIPPLTPGLSVLPPAVVLFQAPRAQAGGVPSPRAETPPGQLIIGVAVPCRRGRGTTGSEASGGNQVEPAKSPHPRCSPRTLNLHSGQVCWSISQGSTQSRWNSCLQGSTRSHCGGRGGVSSGHREGLRWGCQAPCPHLSWEPKPLWPAAPSPLPLPQLVLLLRSLVGREEGRWGLFPGVSGAGQPS